MVTLPLSLDLLEAEEASCFVTRTLKHFSEWPTWQDLRSPKTKEQGGDKCLSQQMLGQRFPKGTVIQSLECTLVKTHTGVFQLRCF